MDDLEQILSLKILAGMLFIFLMLLVAYILHEVKRLHVIPESAAIIVLGAICGVVYYSFTHS